MDSPPANKRGRGLLPALLGVIALALALGVGVVYAWVQVGSRDALIAGLTVDNSDLRNARGALQGDVQRLSEERRLLLESQDTLRTDLAEAQAGRDRVQAERDRLQGERDRFRTERDRLQGERDRFRTELDRLRGEHDQLLTERDTLGRRLTSIPTPTPPWFDESRRAALSKVLELDEQIEAEFGVFTEHLATVANDFNRGNLFALQAGSERANRSADRLKELFAARNRAAGPLR